eukprot:679631-Rhodomonas_salina.9
MAIGAGAVSGKVELVRTLLEHGADITAQDELKDTALHVAAYWGNEAVGRLLVKAGASIEQANRSRTAPPCSARRSACLARAQAVACVCVVLLLCTAAAAAAVRAAWGGGCVPEGAWEQ